MDFKKFSKKSVDDSFSELKSREKGISDKEAGERQKVFGLNAVALKETSLLDIFFRQFRSPFFYLLVIASMITFFIGNKFDTLTILFFIATNVSLGFFQEARAAKTASLLRKYIPRHCHIRREGKEKIINEQLLVPGDVVLLETGNIVPADLRLTKVKNFLIDESVLSGESTPISKTAETIAAGAEEIFEAKNIAFSGTSVVSGEAEGTVIATGKNTVFGCIAKLSTTISKKSTYEKSLIYFSKVILQVVAITIVFLFILNLVLKGTHNFFEFLIFCIALIVSIVPEALPVVITFAFSQGALRLARHKVVVKRLSSIEDLGNIDILCTDKTGTLTENKLSLEQTFSDNKEKCLLWALVSSYLTKEKSEFAGNPFDAALFAKASKEIKEKLNRFTAVSKISFNPLRCRDSALLVGSDREKILVVKGAPEVILDICSKIEGKSKRAWIKKQLEKQGRMGRRTLAIAFKKFNGRDYEEKDEKNLTFLGYFSFIDPLKKTTKETINLAQKLGVKIKILTGDNREVAGYAAKEVGLIENPGEVVLGRDLDRLDAKNLERICDDFSVFARVSPQTKFKIIEALQKKSEVGFLGEGINDAPALKEANVAIAVSNGADISREASDIILLKKDLRVIVNAIKEGRNIFSNINKYIKCISASNFGNFYSIAAISLFISFLPMLPIQILFGNILSDFPLIAVSTDQVDIEELKRPRLYQLSQFVYLIIFLALVSTIFDFIFFAIFHKSEAGVIQTLWFIESIMTEIMLIFSIRTSHFFLNARRPSLTLIGLTILDAIIIFSLPFTKIGREIFHFVLPPLSGLFIVFSLLAGYFIVSETVKLIYFRFWRNHHKFGVLTD